ncbi:MAG: tetratricopeptide repeat protein [Marinilabiliales bacterium]|nr:tetratricopeptide repeat protein [Marinilabiliales bacterium]
MKRTVLFLAFSLLVGSLFAQENIKLQNAGNDAMKAKDYAKAIENYEKAAAAWGDAAKDFGMYYNMAFCAFQLKDLDKALKYFDMCAANNFKPEDALFNELIIYKIQKNTDSYQKVLADGIAKFPESAKFKGEIARNSFSEAIAHFNAGNGILKAAVDKVNAKKFKDANDPGYKAEIAKAKKEFSAAIPALDKALELNPADDKAKQVKEACEKQIKAL